MLAIWQARTIKAKLLIGIGAILAIFALSSAIVLYFVNNLAGNAHQTLTQTVPAQTAALAAQSALIDADDNAAYDIMDPTAANWAGDLHAYSVDISTLRTAIPQLQAAAATAEERATITAFADWFDGYRSATDAALRLKRAGNVAQAIHAFVSFPTQKGQDLIARYAASKADRTQLATAQVEASSRITLAANVAGALAAIVGGAVIALLLGGAIAKRLTTVARAMEDVVQDDFAQLDRAMKQFAAGDLSARIASGREPLVVQGNDETAILTRSYNRLLAGIKDFGTSLSTTGEVLATMIDDVKTTVKAAAQGDLTTRIEAAGHSGVFHELGVHVNALVEVCGAGIHDVARVLDALAKGDLTQQITTSYAGTFGHLKDDANATVTSLTGTIGEIRDAADVVRASAQEIASGNTDLSQRTEEQAAGLQETAASMEELTATVNANAENAKQANTLAIGASEIALRGGRVVGDVVIVMDDINASAKKIVEIISVIDGIAFQTNILALNAAVEAARAGEQGRGFAVVAGEVRTLAQRSAAAAKEIKALIGDSVAKTDAGTRLVSQAGDTMAEIVDSVKGVTEIMAAIAAASEQQGSGIGQVNEAVMQMDKVTQQNAALVEQIAASASSLEERAHSLVSLVNGFTLRGVSQGAARGGSAVRPASNAPHPAVSAPNRAGGHRPAATATAHTDDWVSF